MMYFDTNDGILVGKDENQFNLSKKLCSIDHSISEKIFLYIIASCVVCMNCLVQEQTKGRQISGLEQQLQQLVHYKALTTCIS